VKSIYITATNTCVVNDFPKKPMPMLCPIQNTEDGFFLCQATCAWFNTVDRKVQCHGQVIGQLVDQPKEMKL